MRHAVAFSLVLGGLVVFVFAAPVVIVKSMGGTTADFIILQVVGVSTFVACANSSSWVAKRIGTETAVRIGTALAFASGLGFLAYALAGGNSPGWLIPLWIPMNVGMGLRGPTGYIAAIAAAGSNDARASGLIGLFITATLAIGTAVVAPFLHYGLIAPAIAVVLIIGPALALVLSGPRQRTGGNAMNSPDRAISASGEHPAAATPVHLAALRLANFRNYGVLSLSLDPRPVVLTGSNGAGKTNLLEAVSFLSPGRGLRRAALEAVARRSGDGSWAVAATVVNASGAVDLGTGVTRGADGPGGHQASPRQPRRHAIDRGAPRALARPLADAGDGRPVHRAGLRPAPLPRSRRARHRPAARHPLQRLRKGDARAEQAPLGSPPPTVPGWTRSRPRWPSSPSPSLPRGANGRASPRP